MGWQHHLIAGAKAVFAGAAIGMALPTAFMAFIVFTEGGMDTGEALLLLLIPYGAGLVAAAIGLTGFGWPMTAWLSRRDQESWRAYFTGGIIAGSVPIFLIMLIGFGGLVGFGGAVAIVPALIVSAFGALTGGAVGHFWWVFARRKAAVQNTQALKDMFE